MCVCVCEHTCGCFYFYGKGWGSKLKVTYQKRGLRSKMPQEGGGVSKMLIFKGIKGMSFMYDFKY